MMDMQVGFPFMLKLDENTFDFASTVSTVKPQIASCNSSNSVSNKIKCIISWSAEEKEEVILLENCINSTFYSWKST